MKTFSNKLTAPIFAALMVLGLATGCTQSSDLADPNAAANTYCTTTGCYNLGNTNLPFATPTPTPVTLVNGAVPTPTPLATGSTGILTPVNTAVLNQYIGSPPVNDPSLIQVNLQLSPQGASPQVFLGAMNILFNDYNNGQLIPHDGVFSNGTSSANGNNVNILTVQAGSGIPTYRLFFEDRYGAFIVLLSPPSGVGSDSNPIYTGSIYFRNFNTSAPNPLTDYYYEPTAWCNYGYDPNCTYQGGSFYYQFPSNPNAFCWVGAAGSGPTSGAYDCQNMTVPPSQSGSAAFTLLGTLTGINIHTALGI